MVPTLRRLKSLDPSFLMVTSTSVAFPEEGDKVTAKPAASTDRALTGECDSAPIARKTAEAKTWENNMMKMASLSTLETRALKSPVGKTARVLI
jgi:hypothetical protein